VQSALPVASERAHVKQLLACTLQEVADRAFGYAILEVSIHATEGELLALLVAGLFKSIV
jgi:hypothetical protein